MANAISEFRMHSGVYKLQIDQIIQNEYKRALHDSIKYAPLPQNISSMQCHIVRWSFARSHIDYNQNVTYNVGYSIKCFICIYLIAIMGTVAFIEVTAKQLLQK